MHLDYHYVVIAVNGSELCKKKKSCMIIIISGYDFLVQEAENHERCKLINEYSSLAP